MKILICESEEVLLTAIEFRLSKQGFDVTVCKKTENLSDYLSVDTPELVLIDLDMAKHSGLELVQEVKDRKGRHSDVLLLADPDAEEDILKGFEVGIADFISKPFKPAELLIRVRRILDAKS